MQRFHDELAKLDLLQRKPPQKKPPQKKLSPKKFSLHLEKNLPIGSGLGSSASSIVAAIVALKPFLSPTARTKKATGIDGRVRRAV